MRPASQIILSIVDVARECVDRPFMPGAPERIAALAREQEEAQRRVAGWCLAGAPELLLQTTGQLVLARSDRKHAGHEALAWEIVCNGLVPLARAQARRAFDAEHEPAGSAS